MTTILRNLGFRMPTPAEVEASVKETIATRKGAVLKGAPTAAALEGSLEFALTKGKGPDSMQETAYLTPKNTILSHTEGGIGNLDVWKFFGHGPLY